MSYGNDKSEGNKGNNFPWQHAMLQMQGQQQTTLLGILAASGGSIAPETPTILRASVAGSIPANSKGISIYNAGNVNGKVNGTTLKPGEVVSFSPQSGAVFPATVTYDGTGTDLLITYIL